MLKSEYSGNVVTLKIVYSGMSDLKLEMSLLKTSNFLDLKTEESVNKMGKMNGLFKQAIARPKAYRRIEHLVRVRAKHFHQFANF